MIGVTSGAIGKRSRFLRRKSETFVAMTVAASLNSREQDILGFFTLVNAFVARFAFDYAMRLMGKANVAVPYHRNAGFYNFGERPFLQVELVAFRTDDAVEMGLGLSNLADDRRVQFLG
jgi:hypothetical protein